MYNFEKEGKDPKIKAIRHVMRPSISYNINPAFDNYYDSFEVVDAVIQRGESFGNILLSNGVDYDVINTIATGFNDVFDVRHLRSGKPYSLFCEALPVGHERNFPC